MGERCDGEELLRDVHRSFSRAVLGEILPTGPLLVPWPRPCEQVQFIKSISQRSSVLEATLSDERRETRPRREEIQASSGHASRCGHYGVRGTQYIKYLRPGINGMWCHQWSYSYRYHARSITMRDLLVVRKALQGEMGNGLQNRDLKKSSFTTPQHHGRSRLQQFSIFEEFYDERIAKFYICIR